jgi:uncharacterized membrane protein YqiK
VLEEGYSGYHFVLHVWYTIFGMDMTLPRVYCSYYILSDDGMDTFVVIFNLSFIAFS